jgi:hypothetical protein
VIGTKSVRLLSKVCRVNGAKAASAKPVNPGSTPDRDKFKPFVARALVSMMTSADESLVMLNTSVAQTAATALPPEVGAVARATASPPSRSSIVPPGSIENVTRGLKEMGTCPLCGVAASTTSWARVCEISIRSRVRENNTEASTRAGAANRGESLVIQGQNQTCRNRCDVFVNRRIVDPTTSDKASTGTAFGEIVSGVPLVIICLTQKRGLARRPFPGDSRMCCSREVGYVDRQMRRLRRCSLSPIQACGRAGYR